MIKIAELKKIEVISTKKGKLRKLKKKIKNDIKK